MSNGIAYYPQLVKEMTDDHRELLAAYGDLVKAAHAHDGQVFKSILGQFKSLLVAHLLKEAVKLYIYLRQKLKNDEGTYYLVTSHKRDREESELYPLYHDHY
jgi:hypothetical protein